MMLQLSHNNTPKKRRQNAPCSDDKKQRKTASASRPTYKLTTQCSLLPLSSYLPVPLFSRGGGTAVSSTPMTQRPSLPIPFSMCGFHLIDVSATHTPSNKKRSLCVQQGPLCCGCHTSTPSWRHQDPPDGGTSLQTRFSRRRPW